MINHNKDTFTLHIRITKKCNADCSYCSSYEANASKIMKLSDVEKSIKNIRSRIEQKGLGGKRNAISVQYIGGEVLTVNSDYLESYVEIVRKELMPIFKNFVDGAQSNLIGSETKVNRLFTLFEGRVGTSYDNFTNQRTINGDSNKYKTIFLKNTNTIKRGFGIPVGGIIVLDRKMSNHINEQLLIQKEKKIPTIIRPVFQGGSIINGLNLQEIKDIYMNIYDNWILKEKYHLEPFYTMVKKRIATRAGSDISCLSGCAFQANCSDVSMNLDPNGDIYICQDLSDSKELKIGNALEDFWDEELINKIKDRPNNLSDDCKKCSYLNDCQGGCMKEAIEVNSGVYGKPEMCLIWKTIFDKIDQMIEHDYDNIKSWIGSF